jgi:hypothetical protein
MNTVFPVKTILILAANPKGTSPLRLNEEVREIESGLKRAQQRDFFSIAQKWAVRTRDVQRAMLDINPHIVHFSGHGAGERGLIFEDDAGHPLCVDGSALAGLFELFVEQVECVVLNGCHSQEQAEAIAQHIPYVIGMSQAIGDRAAIEFAVGFYDALGAGRSVEFAYKLGCNAIQLSGIAEYLTPVLINRLREPGTGAHLNTDAKLLSVTSTLLKNSSDSLMGEVTQILTGLTDGERRRLEIERKELQAQIEVLSEEIQFLQSSERIDDLSPKATFRLKKQILQVAEEREKISQKLTELENRL